MSYQLDDRRIEVVRLRGIEPLTSTFAQSRSVHRATAVKRGCPRRSRTADIRFVRATLCQLSYRALDVRAGFEPAAAGI